MDKVDALRQQASRDERHRLSVRLESQADFLAGVWANHAQQMKHILDPRDIDEALAPYRERIVLLRKENGGGASATNVAVHAASAEFVSLLDADDVYEPERLEALGELAAARPDLDVLMTDSYLEADGRVVGRFTGRTPFDAENQRLAILDRCFIAWPAIRRSRVLSVGGFDETMPIGYDWDFWIKILYEGARAGLVEVPLHRYRIRSDSLTGARVETLHWRLAVIEKAADRLDLTAEERAFATRSLRSKRRRLLLTEAEEAIRAGTGDRRRKALSVTFGPGFRPATRVRAGLAALAPRAAALRLEKREAQTGQSRLKRSIPEG